MTRIVMFAENIKHKHYNYSIILKNLRTVILSETLINWLNWKVLNDNNIHLSVSEFVQLEWQNYVNYLKHWKYLIKSASENINTAADIDNFISIFKESELFESTDQSLKVLLLLNLKVFSHSDNINIKMLN